MPAKKTKTKTKTKAKAASKSKTGARSTRKTAARKTVKRKSARKSAAKSGDADLRQNYEEAKDALSKLWTAAAKKTHSSIEGVVDRVEQTYKDSRKKITQDDVKYVLSKAEGTAKTMLKSGTAWVKQLGKQVQLLYQMLRDAVKGEFKLPWATMTAIAAALLYVVNPIDIIPDFIPGIGLVDDALVVSLCISLTRMDLKRYAKERKLDLADYGLGSAI